MSSYTGTVRSNDLEGGFLELVTDSGEVYRLEGAKDASPGQKVRVTGRVESGGFGITMTGSASLVVESIETI